VLISARDRGVFLDMLLDFVANTVVKSNLVPVLMMGLPQEDAAG
jgi:hypothetical protein